MQNTREENKMGVMLKLFDASETMLSIGIPALRIISLGFVFAGYGIAGSSIFQALGCATYNMIMSIARQLAVLLPVAYVLSKTVWFAFPIAEIASVIVCAFFMKRINHQVISKIGEA